jgi:pectinesterase
MEDMMGSESKKLRRNLVLAAAIGMIWCERPAGAADYLLDPNYTGTNGAAANGYAGVYNNIVSALTGTGSVPAGASASSPNRLMIEPGTYNTASTTGVSLQYSRNNVDLIGITGNPDDVIITSTLDSSYNPGTGALGTSGSATIQLKGNNELASAITFANSTDTPYIVNTAHQAVSPTGSYATGQAQTSNAPAVALLLQGDGQVFNNVKVLGYQDTLYSKGGRVDFRNSIISGDVDFIFANGTDVFENSTINLDGDHSGGTVTAASTDKRTSNGLVFLNDTITGNSVKGNPAIDPMNAANANGPAANSMYLGRPWGWQQTGGDASTVFINTKMTPAINSAGWLLWNSDETIAGNAKNGGNPAEDARYAEYNSMDLSGNPLSITGRATWSHQFTAAEAAAYTDANIFSFEGPTEYPWYGAGYPAGDASNPGTGSASPTDPNFSWPAYWGDRDSNNDLNSDLVLNNPTSYSDPSWTATTVTTYDPTIQLATIPEPASLGLIFSSAVLLLNRRRNRRT